jgi:5S rRNA maturation endonuclease (ribonuclease M5)
MESNVSTTFRDCKLDFSKLEKRRAAGERTIARCPACAEQGADAKGGHLCIFPSGAFNCIAHPKDKGHNKRILELVGIPATANKSIGKSALVATYEYNDKAGQPVFQVRRYIDDDGKKTFRQFRREGTTWKAGLNGQSPILFHADKLAAADPKRLVYIVEGEKDVLNLDERHLLATCNPMGAGKWRDTYSNSLKGRTCVILPDHDAPGRTHASAVAESLKGKAASVKVLPLEKTWIHTEKAPCPEFRDNHGADISDAFEAKAVYGASWRRSPPRHRNGLPTQRNRSRRHPRKSPTVSRTFRSHPRNSTTSRPSTRCRNCWSMASSTEDRK